MKKFEKEFKKFNDVFKDESYRTLFGSYSLTRENIVELFKIYKTKKHIK